MQAGIGFIAHRPFLSGINTIIPAILSVLALSLLRRSCNNSVYLSVALPAYTRQSLPWIRRLDMPDFKLPLSGDVTQTINPIAMFFNPVGSQVGLFNINLGTSSDTAIESQVLSDVASYGKQLGRIGDALIVLLKHYKPVGKLPADQQKAIDDLEAMLKGIAGVKERHGAKHVMRP
jgi:hypothetical protein